MVFQSEENVFEDEEDTPIDEKSIRYRPSVVQMPFRSSKSTTDSPQEEVSSIVTLK